MGPIWDAELRVWDAKNFGLVSPATHRNKFVKKSLIMEMLSHTTFDLIVYVEWESRVNFVTRVLVTYIKINFGPYVTI